MKAKIAVIGSFAPAGAAVAGSVTLSLLVLHPPRPAVFPGTAPADRGHIGSLVLPAPHVSRPHAAAHAQVSRPRPSAIAAVTPRHAVTHPVTHPSGPTHQPAPSPPPVVTVPTPVTQPVTTPVTTPTVNPPTVSPPTVIPANHGRWSSPQAKVWKGRAAKQALRVEKGKPPWAGPKKNPPPITTTTMTTTTVPTDVPDPPATPPGQDKTPPGHDQTPPGQDKTPPGQNKTPPGQDKGKSPHG